MASGGWIARTGFLTMDIGWLATTWLGVLAILRGRVREHRGWMLRSYAFTLAAVTLRLYQFPLMLLFAGQFEPGYRVVAWLCWVPNLLIAEWVARRQHLT
ncbi:DUF2306 domain-containing protein [Paenibacillus filicis]|uniref:DUF2306 domain-containing protein n=1 Tax=Paenibacillus filicis TaxID=669464 RepID=A0ABU9DV93_9BACL